MLFHSKRILLMRRMNFFGKIAKNLNLYFVPPKLPHSVFSPGCVESREFIYLLILLGECVK